MSMRAIRCFGIEKTPAPRTGIRDCQCRKCGRQFRGAYTVSRVCNHSAKCPGRVWCAAVGDVCFDAGQGGGWINIKRRHGPFGNGFGGFFDELQDAVVCAQQDIAPAFAVIVVGIVAHGDVRRGIGFECVDEILQGKPQDVVRRENDHIVGNGACFQWQRGESPTAPKRSSLEVVPSSKISMGRCVSPFARAQSAKWS